MKRRFYLSLLVVALLVLALGGICARLIGAVWASTPLIGGRMIEPA